MKKINKKILKIIGYIIIPILIELFFSKKIIIEKSTVIRLAILYGIEIIYIGYFIIEKYKEKIKKVLNWIIEKRYIIITAIFVLCVICKLNLSSINVWKSFINEDGGYKTILGVARTIRADEWLVQSPTMLAQTLNQDVQFTYHARKLQYLNDRRTSFKLCDNSQTFNMGIYTIWN